MPSPAYNLIFSETEDPTTYSKLNHTAHEIKIWDKYCDSRESTLVLFIQNTQKKTLKPYSQFIADSLQWLTVRNLKRGRQRLPKTFKH